MMNKLIIAFLVISVFSLAPVVYADDTGYNVEDETGPGSGMEAKKVNDDVTVLMPVGGKLHSRNRTTFIAESPDEYAARQFVAMNTRLAKMDQELADLKKEVGSVKAMLAESEKNISKGRKDNADPSKEQ